jgi:hypothetical protein
VFESVVLRDERSGLFSISRLRQLWYEHQSGLHNHDRKLWNVLVLGLWHARFAQNRRPEALASATGR